MPVPTAYTEETLAQFMHTTLGRVATALDFVAPVGGPGGYSEAVVNVLLDYGESNITAITGTSNIAKLRAYARYHAWQYAADNAAANTDFTTQGTKISSSQIPKQIESNLEKARGDLMVYVPGYSPAVMGDLEFPYDPYKWVPTEERGV